MVKNELKQLGEYAEELDREDPLDLLYSYINQITEELSIYLILNQVLEMILEMMSSRLLTNILLKI